MDGSIPPSFPLTVQNEPVHVSKLQNFLEPKESNQTLGPPGKK